MTSLITQEEALRRLQTAVDDAGGVGAFADLLDVSISLVSLQLNEHRPIQGKVAKHLGIKIHRETTISYEESDQA